MGARFVSVAIDNDLAQALRIEAARNGERSITKYLDGILRDRLSDILRKDLGHQIPIER